MAAPASIVAGDTLSFWHTRGMESGFDGGVVEVSTNGGGTWTDIGAAAFTSNGYNATISNAWSSPIGGRQAFTGSSPYVKSVASLAAYVGQNILVRFRAASDVSVGGTGWTVDDVTIGKEVVTTNHLALTATGFPSQSQDLTTKIVAPAATVPGAPTVTGSTPSAGAVTVAFNPPASNGGSPITGYTAQCVSTDGGVNAAPRPGRQPARGHRPDRRKELPLPGPGHQRDRDRCLQRLRRHRAGARGHGAGCADR